MIVCNIIVFLSSSCLSSCDKQGAVVANSRFLLSTFHVILHTTTTIPPLYQLLQSFVFPVEKENKASEPNHAVMQSSWRELMNDGPDSWNETEVPSCDEYAAMNDSATDDQALSSPQIAPRYIHYFPKICGFENGPVEATGLVLINFGKGAVAMSTIFLGPALLALANDAAKMTCSSQNDGDESLECDGTNDRVYGMKPSSLLAVIGVVSGLLSTIFLPLFGAIVDHTKYRKEIGACSIAIVTIVKGIEIFVGPVTWFVFSVLQVVNFVLYNAHSCAIYAYTAEVRIHEGQLAALIFKCMNNELKHFSAFNSTK